MPNRRRPQVSSRKQPQQVRSTELVAAILQAAVQVLAREGAARFTSARVAAKAGVSVGSLYQYFPNKAAILFRLQAEEWRETAHMLREILEDTHRLPLDRLRALVHAFITSECAEAKVRLALNDAAPLYRDSPEAQQLRREGDRSIELFMEEVLPDASIRTRSLAGDLVTATLSTVGASFSRSPRTPPEVRLYSEAMADMFCAYLKHLQSHSPK